ncbi:MAG: hypothetical protein ACRCVY_07720 [Commensalibacter sp.]
MQIESKAMKKIIEKEPCVKLNQSNCDFNSYNDLSSDAKNVIKCINASICFTNGLSNTRTDDVFLTLDGLCQISFLSAREALNAIKELQSKNILIKNQDGTLITNVSYHHE